MRIRKRQRPAGRNAGAGAPAGQRGFTLIEVVISMGIMTVVSLGALSLFTYAIHYNGGGNTRAIAVGLAQQRMEQLRSGAFTDTSLAATTPSGTSSTVTYEGNTFLVVTTIQVDATTGVKTVTIKVTPYGGNDLLTKSSVTISILRAPSATGPYMG
jgi:prepilin-type N-terminal cleavage/methylation domain-containing protein